jgi:hypothetical protein
VGDEPGDLRRHVGVAAKGHRRSLHHRMGREIRRPVGRLRACHEVYKISDEQIGLWKKSAEPLTQKWAADVKKAGGDPDTIMKELQASLTQYKAGF